MFMGIQLNAYMLYLLCQKLCWHNTPRPESNMLKSLAQNICRNFSKPLPICSSVFPLCLHYALRIATLIFLLSCNILISECSIRVFRYVQCSLQFSLIALLGSIILFSWWSLAMLRSFVTLAAAFDLPTHHSTSVLVQGKDYVVARLYTNMHIIKMIKYCKAY